MTPLERQLLLDGVPSEAPEHVLLSLGLAFVLGMVVTVVHRRSVPGRFVSPSLQASLALLPVVSAMVLLVIGDSLARAFSLVGALAIVRFRTRLRTTWDITFVFLALAAGIGCGTGKPVIATLGVLVASLAVGILSALPGTAHPSTAAVRIQVDISVLDADQSLLETILNEHCTDSALKSTRSLRFGELLSLTWRAHMRPDTTTGKLIGKLSQVEGVERALASQDADLDDAAS